MEKEIKEELVSGEELKKVARQRQKKYKAKTVVPQDVDSYLQDGWVKEKELKTKVRLRKEKDIGELFEDEVWLLFYKMGFEKMNKDRNFKIRIGTIEKQIDIFAVEQNRIFIIECMASEGGNAVSRQKVSSFCYLKGDIERPVKSEFRRKHLSFIMATKGLRWAKGTKEIAEKENIILLEDDGIEYFRKLVEHLGDAAKYQIYSIIFPKATTEKTIRVAAIRGGHGKGKYYCFVIHPEQLLQVAYIHHRKSTPEELHGTYQRMLNKSRLRRIDRFIDNGGNFANNIIINFKEKPRFDRFSREKQVGEFVFGHLTFPRRLASAWIIDGQHRLYGYANNPRKSTDPLPVLAFEGLPVKEQAKLFVVINKEQKAVPANLLWDLYPDIYHDASEEELKHLRAISLVVRKLNKDEDSPLCGYINIPSASRMPGIKPNLTMATVCEVLKETKILDKEESLLYESDTVDFATERLKMYFNVIKNNFPDDWNKGNKGLLRTNIGIRILLLIFRQILLYIKFRNEARIYKRANLREFKERIEETTGPMLIKLRDMSDQERSAIRKQSAKGLVEQNTNELIWEIKEHFDGFGLERIKDWLPPIPSEVDDRDIRNMIENTERSLRAFIILKLKEHYNNAWWRQGVPGGVKEEINNKIEEHIKETPGHKEDISTFSHERRLNYAYTPHLGQIITYGHNWKKIFGDIFAKNKDYTNSKFSDFEYIRNKYQHFTEEELDEIRKNLGYWAMRWIRKCIGEE